jgi:hypothetical protein
MLCSSVLEETSTRRLTPVQWNREGRTGFVVRASHDVPSCHDGMIRRALLRSSLESADLDGLKVAIDRELWAVGYAATVQADPAEGSVVVEVRQLR